MKHEGQAEAAWAEVSLVFPASARKVLMLASAERAAAAALVRSVPGVSRAIVGKAKLGGVDRVVVQTEGVNLPAVWALDAAVGALQLKQQLLQQQHAGAGAAAAAAAAAPSPSPLDLPHLVTNDIAAVLRVYGVEAARACLAREMRSVFDAYGIGVDGRHLTLIADYMTHGGGFRAMNRIGMEAAHGSPLLKMSFETTTAFMTKALLSGEADAMVTPAARIALGRIVDSGTGVLDVWAPLQQAQAPPSPPAWGGRAWPAAAAVDAAGAAAPASERSARHRGGAGEVRLFAPQTTQPPPPPGALPAPEQQPQQSPPYGSGREGLLPPAASGEGKQRKKSKEERRKRRQSAAAGVPPEA